jgi:hypothetical protein
VEHFLRTYPRESREAGGRGPITDLVKDGIRKAATYGYEGKQDVGFFVALQFILGTDFDIDPQLPWAAEQLKDEAIRTPAIRMERVYDSALEYLGATAGGRLCLPTSPAPCSANFTQL